MSAGRRAGALHPNRQSPMRGIPILMCLAVLAGCESITEQPSRVGMTATLHGESVKPAAVQTGAVGSFTGMLLSLRGDAVLEYSLDFSALSSAAERVHLHGPAGADAVAGVIVEFDALPAGSQGTVSLGGKTGTGSGVIDLLLPVTSTISGDSLHKLLHAGLVYMDVHTVLFPDGELRGQVLKR